MTAATKTTAALLLALHFVAAATGTGHDARPRTAKAEATCTTKERR